MEFIHLHNHTHYSVLDGAMSVDSLLNKAQELNMSAIAITDHGNMCGVIEFYKKAKARGIKPIIGQEFYIAPDLRYNKKYEKGEKSNYHLLLLAENIEGYKNLLKLSSVGYTEGFYYKPRIDFEVLEKYHNGLICASACLGGEIPYLIMNEKYNEARQIAKKYKDLFGKDRYYLELQDHGIPEQKPVNKELAKMSNELDIPLIATNDSHYLSKDDAYAHSVLLCIQTGKKMSDENRFQFPTEEFYLKNQQEMEELFNDYPGAISNTKKIADMCNLELVLDKPVLPDFKIPDGHTLDSYLKEIVYSGAHEKYGKILSEEVKTRIEYELSVIISMKYPGYFLIVWDFIKYAKQQNIPVGPGRGSAAGSIVSYCMGITLLNPLKYNLLFERFLNPDRNELPDMDIDFCCERREEVIKYIKNKYGKDHVSQIMAFNTLKPKAAFKDVARVLDVSFTEANKISKHINEKTLKESLNKSKEFYEFYKNNELNKKIIDTAMRLENLIKSFGKHAAGVVISKNIITEYAPLYKIAKDNVICSQFEKGASESAGLVKMDILGLKNLTIINNCLKLIESNKGKKLNSLNLNNEKVYKLLSNADTNGVFQLESSGMQAMLKRLKPNCFDDIIAAVALYRPGPLDSGMTEQFIIRKRNHELIKYSHPCLEPILKDTYGVIVYQEQVMKISQVMGGFSLAEADKLRKAMGKKKIEIIEEMENKFLEGAKEKNIDPEIAKNMYNAMSKFAEYGFNKSHAAGYALIAYQTAYLKTHYKIEYMTALLSASANNQKDITRYAKGIEILPPDINKSDFDFTIGNNQIRFGFKSIKGVGNKAIESILNKRKELNNFTTLNEFLKNIDLRVVNKRVLESLVKSGSFDCFNENRAQLFNSITVLQEIAKKLRNNKSIDNIYLNNQKEWQENIKLLNEKEVCGIYLSGHPLKNIEVNFKYTPISKLGVLVRNNINKTRLVGMIENLKPIITKKGDPMAFAILEDLKSSIELIIFPKPYAKYKQNISLTEPVIIVGKIEVEDETNIKIFVEEIEKI